MQLIQISDLHIRDNSNIDLIKNKIVRLFEALQKHLNHEDCTVICILGDIVDQGKSSNFALAEIVIKYIEDTFVKYRPSFVFTPGNHDLCACPHTHPLPPVCPDQKCTLSFFYDFMGKFDASPSTDSISIKHYDDIDLLIANSTYTGNCKYGVLDIAAIERIDLSKPTLVLTHHTLLSENNEDASAIRNAYKLLEQIEKKEILGVLHGHTHGYKDINIGEKCPVVGVGPFLKDVPNVNNQANLVIVTASGIHKVINFYFRADLDRFESLSVFENHNSIYSGSIVDKTYKRIVMDTKLLGAIFNLNMIIETKYKDFNAEIEHVFPEQIEVARLWQDTSKVPDSLYYNHGQYMKSKDISAITFVAKELHVKPTSSRAIIPLINFENVIDSGDKFLPSFDLVQFGFTSDERSNLVVTLYLRALEVNHFLKINLCEIYLMCKEISKEITTIREISINLHAFRAQFKEKFGCFKRAELDRISEADIAYSLWDDIPKIIRLLQGKRDLYETVIENCGMRSLHNAIESQNYRKPIKEPILKSIDKIISTMKALEAERKKTSNYVLIESTEKELTADFNRIIHLLSGDSIYI